MELSIIFLRYICNITNLAATFAFMIAFFITKTNVTVTSASKIFLASIICNLFVFKVFNFHPYVWSGLLGVAFTLVGSTIPIIFLLDSKIS